MNRNKAFDLLKLLFTIIIVIHHSGYFYGVLNRGYIAVEFFFITSGYFLYRTYETNKTVNTLAYFKKRAYRLYPEYWFAFAVIFITLSAMHSLPYKDWYSPIIEFLMLQNIGIPGLSVMNYPCWYLSVLMVGGTLVYFLLYKLSRKYFNIVAVVIIAMTYLYLIIHSSDIEQWNTVGYVIYIPFWRGMADMLIGTLIYQSPEPKNQRISLICECCCGIGIVLFLRLPGNYDYLTLAMIIVLVWSIRSDKSLLRKIGDFRVFDWVGKYQYSIYVNHICVILIFQQYLNNRGINGWVLTAMLLLSVFLIAVADKAITNKMIQKYHLSF